MNLRNILNELKDELEKLGNIFLGSYIIEVQKNPLYFVDVILEDETMKFDYISSLRAYFLLTNAAFESAVEEISKYMLEKSIILWKEKNQINRILRHFILGSNPIISNINFENGKFNAQNYTDNFEKILEILKENFYKVINSNHGVKRDNLLEMFSYLGLVSQLYSSELITELESWGKDRGTFAHHKFSKAFTLSSSTISFEDPTYFIIKTNRILELIRQEYINQFIIELGEDAI